MSIQLTSDDFDVSPSMHVLTKNKLVKVEQRLVDVQNIRVVLNKGPGDGQFLAKIELYFKGKGLFAESVSYSIESALVAAVESIDRQITKEKDKIGSDRWDEKRDSKWFSSN